MRSYSLTLEKVHRVKAELHLRELEVQAIDTPLRVEVLAQGLEIVADSSLPQVGVQTGGQEFGVDDGGEERVLTLFPFRVALCKSNIQHFQKERPLTRQISDEVLVKMKKVEGSVVSH